MKYLYESKGKIKKVEVIPDPGGEFLCNVGAKNYRVRVLRAQSGTLELNIGADNVAFEYVRGNNQLWIHAFGWNYSLKRITQSSESGSGEDRERILRAPMPGQVRKLFAAEGQAVKTGDVLLLLEAMKMEIKVLAPMDGKVAHLAVSEGQSVDREQMLVELDEE